MIKINEKFEMFKINCKHYDNKRCKMQGKNHGGVCNEESCTRLSKCEKDEVPCSEQKE